MKVFLMMNILLYYFELLRLTSTYLSLNRIISLLFYFIDFSLLCITLSSYQVLVLFQEDMAVNTLSTLRIVENFLGIPCHDFSTDAIINVVAGEEEVERNEKEEKEGEGEKGSVSDRKLGTSDRKLSIGGDGDGGRGEEYTYTAIRKPNSIWEQVDCIFMFSVVTYLHFFTFCTNAIADFESSNTLV